MATKLWNRLVGSRTTVAHLKVNIATVRTVPDTNCFVNSGICALRSLGRDSMEVAFAQSRKIDFGGILEERGKCFPQHSVLRDFERASLSQ